MQFGKIVDAKVITDRETGRSRRFGFVTFANDDDATGAVSEMDGAELDGRTIKLSLLGAGRKRTAAREKSDA
jgi:cold-inducible RNA-binding protein